MRDRGTISDKQLSDYIEELEFLCNHRGFGKIRPYNKSARPFKNGKGLIDYTTNGRLDFLYDESSFTEEDFQDYKEAREEIKKIPFGLGAPWIVNPNKSVLWNYNGKIRAEKEKSALILKTMQPIYTEDDATYNARRDFKMSVMKLFCDIFGVSQGKLNFSDFAPVKISCNETISLFNYLNSITSYSIYNYRDFSKTLLIKCLRTMVYNHNTKKREVYLEIKEDEYLEAWEEL